MSEQKINLEEILSHYVDTSDGYISDFSGESFCPIEAIECAMREFAEQLLELAAENANMIGETQHDNRAPDVFEDFVYVSDSNGPDYGYTVNKQSILDTIKQVE
jgi:hypothetical protein